MKSHIIKNYFKKTKSRKKQQGMAVLSISIILLVLITLVSVYLARAILFEQKLVNNDLRARQAFENAEAGLSAAMQAVALETYWDDNDNIIGVFDTDGDGDNDSLTTIYDSGSVAVAVSPMVINDLQAFAFQATGSSDDGSANRTVTGKMQALNPLPFAPDNPLSTRGSLDVNGSATVHNAEGHSTIWSGGDIDIGSNNSTATYIANPADAGYPACMDVPNSCATVQTSNKETVGLDILEHDSDLARLTAAEMFENFFGVSPAHYKETRVTMLVSPSSPGDAKGCAANTYEGCVIGATNEVIWYDGAGGVLEINGGTVGCEISVTGSAVCPQSDEAPVILIIDGDVEFSGNPHFYGIFFVMGEATASGSSTFHGAVISGGSFNTTSGSLDVHYNSRLLTDVSGLGPQAVAAGSWKDF